MQNFQENLQDLLDNYYRNGKCAIGLNIITDLKKNTSKDFSFLENTKKRWDLPAGGSVTSEAAVQAVIDFFSLLELAVNFGYIDEDLPKDIVSLIEETMDYYGFRSYVINHYKTILPSNLLFRLENRSSGTDILPPAAQVVFIKLLDIDLTWKEDIFLNTFLKYDREKRLLRLGEILKSPELLDKYLNGPINNRYQETIQAVLYGYFNFLHILEDFENIVAECEEFPQAESLIASYFSRLFDYADLDRTTSFTKDIFYANLPALEHIEHLSYLSDLTPGDAIEIFDQRVQKIQRVFVNSPVLVS